MEHSSNRLEQFLDANAISKSIASGALADSLGERTINCDTHGEYTSTGKMYLGKREIWSRCPGCVQDYDDGLKRKEEERRALARQAEMERAIESAAIPKRFIGRMFDNFNANTDEQQAALRITQEYAADFGNHMRRGTGLILSGLPGTGKSHLAAAILQAIMPRHVGLYITCMGMIRNVRGTWRKDSERSETEVLAILCEVDLLVVDEIGVQYGTDGEQTILFDVLDRRYRNMMPTILLTNQAKQGFKDFIGERSYDRLTETSRWVSFDWASYRPQARKDLA